MIGTYINNFTKLHNQQTPATQINLGKIQAFLHGLTENQHWRDPCLSISLPLTVQIRKEWSRNVDNVCKHFDENFLLIKYFVFFL